MKCLPTAQIQRANAIFAQQSQYLFKSSNQFTVRTRSFATQTLCLYFVNCSQQLTKSQCCVFNTTSHQE